jgi:hypothetical protein
VSLELPSAPSLRPSVHRPARRKRRGLIALSCLFGISALVLLGALALSVIGRPRLDALVPAIGPPGQELSLSGAHFGAARGESFVDADGLTPVSSAYLEWSDARIRLKLPASFDSGLVRVVTRKGRSNPKIFMNEAKLPKPIQGGATGVSGGPRIDALSPDEGTLGSLVAVSGSGFGESRGDSRLLFSWTSDTEGGVHPEDRQSPSTIAIPESDAGYAFWSDSLIRARIPDGAISGPVLVRTARGDSKGAFLRVFPSGGSKRLSSRISYSLAQSVSVTHCRVSSPAELYLWAPLPADSDSQRLVRVLGQEPPPVVGDYQGTALYRFAELANGQERTMRQSFLVQVSAVEATIDPGRQGSATRDPPALMAAYSAPDPLVPSDAAAVQALANKILRGDRGDWKAACLVWDWLLAKLAWTERGARDKPLDALADRRADSYSYSIIAAALLRAAGLPARPVAGYLVDQNLKAVRHYWDEVYLYGLGWIALDPVLGSGAEPGGMRAPWDDRSRYLGGIDDRHIAFSRGFSRLAPLIPSGRRVAKERRWSFQSFYEEASSGLLAYSSYWGDVEVTGAY